MTRVEAPVASLAGDLKRLAELEELLVRVHAERLGIHVTDVRCLVAVADEGTATAGSIAAALGLSSGATTAMLDRLEKLGLVRRHKGDADRRQVLVSLAGADPRVKDAAAVWSRIARRTLAALSPAAAEQLRPVVDALSFGLSEEVERVRGAAASRGETTGREARLVIKGGGHRVVVDAGGSERELVTVRGGTGASVDVDSDVVTVSGGLIPLRKSAPVTLALAPVRWRIEVKGGASHLDMRLGALDVRGVEISGGAHQITLLLGEAHAVVPVRLMGGASNLTVLRPRGVGARVVVSGGLSGAVFDGDGVSARGGPATLVSAGFSARAPHYDVEIKGGASHVTVGVVDARG